MLTFLIILIFSFVSAANAQIEFVGPGKVIETELIVKYGPCDTIACMILLENGLYEGSVIEKQYEITYYAKDPDQVGLVLQHYENFQIDGKPVTPLAWRKKIPVGAFIRSGTPIQFYGGFGSNNLGIIHHD